MTTEAKLAEAGLSIELQPPAKSAASDDEAVPSSR